MRIGIPKEIKTLEGRVGLVPEACADLVQAGHQVLLETGAGNSSGFEDTQYQALGVEIIADAASLYEHAGMIVKVKEPVGPELLYLRDDHILFCFLHLAANTDLAKRLQEIGLTAIAFETVDEGGKLPILAPMSDIAGRISIQVASHLLHMSQGGRGILLGGLPAAERGKVVILGGGVAGTNAARMAAAMGAEVTVFDLNRDRLEILRDIGPNVTALYPYKDTIKQYVTDADVLVGAVLVAGARTPHLVSAELVEQMKLGSVIIDISVDQGGCIETIQPTTYEQPTYVWEGVIHFGVTNMPGAVPRTASQALSAALIPYVHRLAEGHWEDYTGLQTGINVRAGKIVHPVVASALGC